MPGVLAQVADAFEKRGDSLRLERGIIPPSTIAETPPVEELIDRVFSTFDPDHGGFGTEPKFPLVAPLRLALDLWNESHDPRFETVVVTTLDAMGWGGLYDDADGGFFRYAATRGWELPHSEKMLESNAALLRLYLDAGASLGSTRFTERAADVLRYIQTWLADPVDGGWAGSQSADARYYAAPADARRSLDAPAVARALYADSNAAMVSAALQAAAVFGDEGLRDFALKSFERVLLACYKPGAGVAHYFDGEPRVRGLLADQLAMAAASLDAFDLTANVVYEMMAEELVHFATRTMWDAASGGFFDRAEEGGDAIGLMRRRIKPFVANCDAVRMLRRLAAASGDHEFSHLAQSTLAAMAPRAREHGPLAAHYLLALRDDAVR